METYDQIIQAFHQDKSLAMTADMTLYDGLQKTEKFEKMQLDYRKKGDQTYIGHQEFEVLQDRKDYLYMDHDNQAVYQLPMTQKEFISSGFAMDQLRGIIKDLHLKGEAFHVEEGIDGIRFSAPEFSRTKIEIQYQIENLQMVKAMMALDLSGLEDVSHEMDGKRLEIHYQQQEDENISFPVRKRQLLAADENGKLKGGPCKGYRLVRLPAE
ncbi:MAG: hypothetical protein AAFV25_26685 [Bacteroidota bacterium]